MSKDMSNEEATALLRQFVLLPSVGKRYLPSVILAILAGAISAIKASYELGTKHG